MESPKKLRTLIEELRNYNHCFLTPDAVEHFTSPFGFKGTTTKATSDPTGTFKGLTHYDHEGKPLPAGTEREGQSAEIVAKQICDHLNVEYPRMYGRDSQLGVCCDAIEGHCERLAGHREVA